MIRLATLDDSPAIADIYRPAVVERPSSFELIPPDAGEMARRIEANLQVAPWLVYEFAGEVIGYANGGIHRQRPAYRWTIETSIYIDPAAHGQGIGRKLYTALLTALGYQGFRTAVAGVTLPNDASVALHRKMGYTPVGVFHHIGHKFGGWRDVAWFELPLAAYEETPAEPRSMEELLADPAFTAILDTNGNH
jgi:phosphinothricin acetyltransferase